MGFGYEVSILQMFRLNTQRGENAKRFNNVSILQMFRLNIGMRVYNGSEWLDVSILQMFRLNIELQLNQYTYLNTFQYFKCFG